MYRPIQATIPYPINFVFLFSACNHNKLNCIFYIISTLSKTEFTLQYYDFGYFDIKKVFQ